MFNEANNLNSVETDVKTERSVEEMEKELEALCEKYDNKIIIHRSGTEIPAEIPALRDFDDDLGDGEYKNTLKFVQEGMIEFLHNPIFTDSFHQDHYARAEWEEKVEKELLAADLYAYYQKNSLNINVWSVVKMLDNIGTFNFPAELVQALQKIYHEAKNDIPSIDNYYSYSDEEKIASIYRIESVVKKILNIISIESDN